MDDLMIQEETIEEQDVDDGTSSSVEHYSFGDEFFSEEEEVISA